MADLEYRTNITVKVFGEIAWYTAQLSVFEVLYMHASAISGWDVNAMRVFMGTLFFGDVLYMILFQENMDNFTNLIRKGDLDLYLVKPVDSQFMVSCRKLSTAYVVNLGFILAYLIWAVSRLPGSISVVQVFTFAVMLFFGLLILYAVRFMFLTIAVFMQNGANIHFVWYQLYRLATRPDPIFPFVLRTIILTAFPVAFFASVPSRILVEGMDWGLIVSSPLIAILVLWGSHAFWNLALRNYASASS